VNGELILLVNDTTTKVPDVAISL